ncbi:MAG: transposase [Acidobacteriaceae bacterium]|nr:transposase [Acidobacteriaceae bacterium]
MVEGIPARLVIVPGAGLIPPETPVARTRQPINATELPDRLRTLPQVPRGLQKADASTCESVHIILDNLSATKTAPVEDFLQQHPKVQLHFAATYSSWFDQVELWYPRIDREGIARSQAWQGTHAVRICPPFAGVAVSTLRNDNQLFPWSNRHGFLESYDRGFITPVQFM